MPNEPIYKDTHVLTRNVGHFLVLEIHVRSICDENQAIQQVGRFSAPFSDCGTLAEHFLDSDIRGRPRTVFHLPAGNAELITQHVRYKMGAMIVIGIGVMIRADLGDVFAEIRA